jgi:PadR family transcriptional regulator, regulatory protein PadR
VTSGAPEPPGPATQAAIEGGRGTALGGPTAYDAASHGADAARPKDFLRSCLLLLVSERPSHGYDLHARLRSLGVHCSDRGRLYRTLRSLEREGLVFSSWRRSTTGPRRRSYEITVKGRRELGLRARALAAERANLERFLSRYAERGTDLATSI